MKPLLPALIFMLAGVTGCKTPTHEPDPAPTESTTTTTTTDGEQPPEPTGPPGPFEVAEEWLEIRQPTTDAVEAVADDWSAPWVERMHRDGSTYRALALGGTEPAEGILLTLEEADGEWSVTGAEVVPADYLWPTR
jgi:hypothetical protein